MPNPDLCSELSPPVPPACAKVTWKPSQTGGESLCACGIKQKSKQIAKQEGTYSPGLKIFNLRTCREACPTATDAWARPLLRVLMECCWPCGVFCRYSERNGSCKCFRGWAPADVFGLWAADVPLGGHRAGRAAWGGGVSSYWEHGCLHTFLFLRGVLW